MLEKRKADVKCKILRIPLSSPKAEILQVMTRIVFKAEKYGGHVVPAKAPDHLKNGDHFAMTLIIAFKGAIRRKLFEFMLRNFYQFID